MSLYGENYIWIGKNGFTYLLYKLVIRWVAICKFCYSHIIF